MLLAVLLDVAAGPPAQAAEPAELFKAKCSACHSEQKVVEQVRKRADVERGAYLDQFLPSHFVVLDPVERAAVARHLCDEATR